MAHDTTWAGLAKGMLVPGVLWWAWVGYAWLTSVVDPEEGIVRLVIFVAMAVHRFSWQRLAGAIVCLALLPVPTRVPALLALTLLALVLWTVVAYEYFRFGELRARLRAQLH